MSAEWTFLIFMVVGTLAFVLAPEVWQKAFIGSRLGRWIDSVYAVLGEAFERFWGWLLAPVFWVARKMSRG